MQVGEGQAFADGLDEHEATEDPVDRGDLVIRVELPPSHGSRCGDRFTLRSVDGTYDTAIVVKDDHVAGDAWVDLVFRDLDRAKRYSLAIATIDGDEIRVFNTASYAELAGISDRASASVARDRGRPTAR